MKKSFWIVFLTSISVTLFAQDFRVSRQQFGSSMAVVSNDLTRLRSKMGITFLGTMHGEGFSVGMVTPVEKEPGEGIIPEKFYISQNFPNPFNSSTRFQFDLPTAQHVSIEIYTLLGQRVTTLFDGHRLAGQYVLRFDGRDARGFDLASGLYFCQFRAGGYVHTIKFSIVR